MSTGDRSSATGQSDAHPRVTRRAGHGIRIAAFAGMTPESRLASLVTAMTVLLIDDDDGWRSTLACWLEQEGFRHVDMPRGEWHARAAEPHGAAVVVLDLRVPGADDLELLSAMCGRSPRVPVIVTTALGESETGEAALRRGAACYLEKPFRIADLVRQLRRVTARDALEPCRASGPREAKSM